MRFQTRIRDKRAQARIQDMRAQTVMRDIRAQTRIRGLIIILGNPEFVRNYKRGLN